MATNPRNSQYGGASSPDRGTGLYTGRVTLIYDDGRVRVFIKTFGRNIGPCRIINKSAGDAISLNDEVLCTYANDTSDELIVIGRLTERVDPVSESTSGLVVEATTTAELVRITQKGTGAALLVEDSTNVDSTPFIIDASGKVGIGTTSPAAMLHVTDSSGYGAQIRSTTNLGLLGSNGESDGLRISGGIPDQLTVGGNIYVYGNTHATRAANVTINTNGTEVITVDSSGNVGIGNTSPTTKLDVTGSALISGTVTIDDDLIVTGTLTTSLIPTGTIVPYAGGTEPSGWLFCNGQQVLASSTLGTLLSTTYNTGGETTGYNRVPDLRGRTVIAADTMSAGGVTTAAGRVTSNNARGNSSGSQTHTLTEAELRAHTHSINHDHAAVTSGSGSTHNHTANHGHGHTISASGGGLHGHDEATVATNQQASDYYVKRIGTSGSNWDFYSGATTRFDSAYYARASSGGSTHSHSMSGSVSDNNSVTTSSESSHTHSVDVASLTGTSGSTGSSSAHNNMQPYLVLNYIIKT